MQAPPDQQLSDKEIQDAVREEFSKKLFMTKDEFDRGCCFVAIKLLFPELLARIKDMANKRTK